MWKDKKKKKKICTLKYSLAPEILCWTVGVALNRHQNDDNEEDDDVDEDEEDANVAVVESFGATDDCTQQVTWTSAKNETATRK